MSFAPPGPSPLAPGFRLDRYELICPIAEGGMASVWIARQQGKHGFKKLVAVKTILPKYAAEPRFQRMFIDEARISSRIEHANVTQVLDVGEQNGVTYLVMEYVDGDALSKVHRAAQKKGQLVPQAILLRIMADVCGGLHLAHELKDEQGRQLGVVHRDVSPQNVLVSSKGVAKLIDFGIAKARDRLGGDTNTDQLKGKVQYMAPEQALGRVVDRRTDVWAVGAVLHHLLTGKPPFEAANEIQTLFLLTSGRPPVPMPASVPAPVAAVVKRSLTSAADKRYATAAELQEALEEAMIKANLVTTTNGVATYLAQMVGERAEKRKESIALGLKVADDRDKVADIMRSNAEATGSASDPGTRIPTIVLGPDSPSSTSATGQTLGSSAMATPMRERRRGRTVAVVGGVVAIGLAIAVGVVATRTTKAAPMAAQAARPAAPSAIAATPPTPAPPVAPETASAAPEPPEAAAAPSSRPAIRWIPAPTLAPVAVPKPTATTKRRVNDGF